MRRINLGTTSFGTGNGRIDEVVAFIDLIPISQIIRQIRQDRPEGLAFAPLPKVRCTILYFG